MIAVLLLTASLMLGGLGVGVYALFFHSSPPVAGNPGPASRPESSAPPRPGSTAPHGTRPGASGGSSGAEGPRPGNTDDLRSTARDYVDAVNDRDEPAATALTCKRADPGALYSVTGGREVRLGRVAMLDRSVGTAEIRVGGNETELLMEKQEDGWCVAI